jgi:hemolysin III
MNMKKNRYNQSLIEEIANSATHGFGLGLSVAGFIVLMVFANAEGNPWKTAAFLVYGTSLTVLYLTSTIYHSLTHSRLKAIFRRLDHSAIYLLIAGTYTPVILISLRDTWVIWLLPIIWLMAIFGVYMKIFYIHRYERLTLWFYLIMGWMAILAAKPLFEAISMESFIWIIMGGMSYTFGVIFYSWRSLPFQHAIWHGFVLIGSVFHYWGILHI